MAFVRNFDTELAALEALRDVDRTSTEAAFCKALTHRKNFIVAEAAKLTALHHHFSLVTDLVAALPASSTTPPSLTRNAGPTAFAVA